MFLSVYDGEIRIIKYEIIEYYYIQYNINIYEIIGNKLNYSQVQGSRISCRTEESKKTFTENVKDEAETSLQMFLTSYNLVERLL